MAEKLEFDVLVGKNDLKGALNESSNYAQSISSMLAGGVKPAAEAAQAATKSLNEEMAGFVKTTLAVGAGNLLFQAMSTAINFVSSSIRGSIGAYAEQEDAINRLNQSLRATGSFSDSSADSMSAFASELEATSKYSDDAILGQIAFAKSLGATNQQAKDLVLAAANLSATIGGSLEENVDKLGKTLAGSAGRLSQYVPELQSLTKEQLRAGAAAEIINKKFSGSAANDLNSYNGSIAALGNQFNNLQETIGGLIVKSSAYQSILKSLKETIDETNTFQKAQETMDSYSKGQGAAGKTAQQLAIDYENLGKELENLNGQIDAQSKRSSFSKFIFDDDTSALIKLQINDLVKLRGEIEEKLIFSKNSIAQEKVDAPQAKIKTADEIEAAKKRAAEIKSIDSQLSIDRLNAKAEEDNAKIVDEGVRNIAEIQRIYAFEAQKKEVEAQLKLTNAQASLEGDALKQEQIKIGKEKELAILDAYSKKEVALTKNTVDQTTKAKKAGLDEQVRQMSYLNQQSTASFALASALAKDGSKEQFAINKASAVAQVLIARATGIANALLLPPPAIPGAIANANIVAGISLATIAATAIKGYANGGIIGGANGISGGGDDQLIAAKTGEMYLNGPQQKKVFDILNGGGGGMGDIVIHIDGREIARVVRDQKQAGFVF